MEITDKQSQQQQQFQLGQNKLISTTISQTERYGSTSIQQRMLYSQEEQYGLQEDRCEKINNHNHIQQSSFNNSSSTTVATNQTIDNIGSSLGQERKKIPLQRPIPIKSLKRAESTNENFYTATQEKLLHSQGLLHMTKLNGTTNHFGVINGKLAKSNPLELLKNMQRESLPRCAQSSSQQSSITPLQSANQQSNYSQNLTFKLKKNLEFNKKILNNQQQFSEKQNSSPIQENSIENIKQQSKTEQQNTKAHNNSFKLEELPFKQKNQQIKTTLQQSQTQSSLNIQNQQNQSPQLLQQQQILSSSNQMKKNVTLTNFHQITQAGLQNTAPSTSCSSNSQQNSISPLQSSYYQTNSIQSSSSQIQQQPTLINGGSLSYPFGSLAETKSKPIQRNLYSYNSFPINNNTQNTACSSINPQTPTTTIVKNESQNKIAFRFSLKKTNCSNLSAAFSQIQQQQTAPQQKYTLADLQKSRDCNLQYESNGYEQFENQEIQISEEPFELIEQEEYSSSQGISSQNDISPSSYNNALGKNEKSKSFYSSSKQFSSKSAGNDIHPISSLNDISKNNQLRFSITDNKNNNNIQENQNQLKKKINDAMSRATYYSTNFEKQKLFEQQNEEEEANFRELCQVFSIM